MLAKMLKRAVDYLPGLAHLNGIRAWTGFRAASPDGLPLVGQHPQRQGLWLAVGHEGLGVTTAPATADLLVAQLFDETPPLAAQPYLPQRFWEIRPMPDLFLDGRPLSVANGTSVAAALALGADGCSRTSVSGQRRAPLCGMGICQECRVLIDGRRRLACQTLCHRRHAGADPTMNEATDLLIIGAGPAGMAAALAAASSGARIMLLDDNPLPGGQIWRDGPQANLPSAARRLREQLQSCANVRCHAGTRVIACAADKTLLVEDAERGWQISYERLILCTGARELLLPFPGWTLPGVTGAGGLQALIKGGLPVRGERLVIAGSGPLLLAGAATAKHQGARVLRIAEQASRTAVVGFAAQLPRWPGKFFRSFSPVRPALPHRHPWWWKRSVGNGWRVCDCISKARRLNWPATGSPAALG